MKRYITYDACQGEFEDHDTIEEPSAKCKSSVNVLQIVNG